MLVKLQKKNLGYYTHCCTENSFTQGLHHMQSFHISSRNSSGDVAKLSVMIGIC